MLNIPESHLYVGVAAGPPGVRMAAPQTHAQYKYAVHQYINGASAGRHDTHQLYRHYVALFHANLPH